MKTFFAYIVGIGTGLALAYYADPKGSQKKLKEIEKELKKNRKIVEDKLDEYKETYNHLVDKYAKSSKAVIDNAKDKVDKIKNTAKA